MCSELENTEELFQSDLGLRSIDNSKYLLFNKNWNSVWVHRMTLEQFHSLQEKLPQIILDVSFHSFLFLRNSQSWRRSVNGIYSEKSAYTRTEARE